MAKTSTHKISRTAPRCSKCPGRPLRAKCVHTKAGLTFLASVNTSNEPGSPTIPVGSNSQGWPAVPVGSNSRGWPAIPVGSNIHKSPAIPVAGQESEHMQDGPSVADVSTLAMPSSTELGDQPNIDPFLLVQSSQGSTALASYVEVNVSPGTPETPTPTAGKANSMDSKSSHSRNRITAGNPTYGYVEGAMRGRDKHDVLRFKEPRPPLTTARLSAKRFHRVIGEIIDRCENVSNETGCWLYIAAQHPTASAPFTHYASARLRRDARSHVVQIQQQFHKMFSALQTSRRQEAMELAAELAQAQEQQRDTVAEVEQVRNALSEERAKIAAQEALIARLQAIASAT